jgi:hypothetical protein
MHSDPGMKTTRITLRLDTRLAALVNRAGAQKTREILASGLGRPDLAQVQPTGRPPKKPANLAK